MCLLNEKVLTKRCLLNVITLYIRYTKKCLLAKMCLLNKNVSIDQKCACCEVKSKLHMYFPGRSIFADIMEKYGPNNTLFKVMVRLMN